MLSESRKEDFFLQKLKQMLIIGTWLALVAVSYPAPVAQGTAVSARAPEFGNTIS